MNTQEKKLLYPEDLARETGLGLNTIYRQLKKDKIPGAVRIGDRRWAVSRSSFEKWINGESNQPKTAC